MITTLFGIQEAKAAFLAGQQHVNTDLIIDYIWLWAASLATISVLGGVVLGWNLRAIWKFTRAKETP